MNKNIFKKLWFWVLVAIAFIAVLIPVAMPCLTLGERVAYLGTLLGSAATIFAVVMTINYSRKSQINAFKAELEKERKEKWFAEVKELYLCTISTLTPAFFIQNINIKEVTRETAKMKILEIESKKAERVELLSKIVWNLRIAPISETSDILQCIRLKTLDEHKLIRRKWNEFAELHTKYFKLLVNDILDDAIREKSASILEECNSKQADYNKDWISTRDVFQEQTEKLRKLIDQEYENILKNN